MKKKVIVAFLLGTILAFAGAYAYAEEVIGSVYSSETNAFIDGQQIPVYVYENYPYIVAEDLERYGFDVSWDADSQIVDLDFNEAKAFQSYEMKEFDFAGWKLADVYSSDTRVRLGGDFIKAYSLSGRMLICLDDLWRCGKVNWYEDSMAISFTSNYFMEKVPDWETLMPAHTLYYGLWRAFYKVNSLFYEINWAEADMLSGDTWSYYNVAVPLDTEIKSQLGKLKWYTEDCLSRVEQNTSLYYYNDFCEIMQSMISAADMAILYFDTLYGKPLADCDRDTITEIVNSYVASANEAVFRFNYLLDPVLSYVTIGQR